MDNSHHHANPLGEMPLRARQGACFTFGKKGVKMGWAIGFDSNWNRDIGHGVLAICDHPGCNKRIDRGLAYVCGSDAYGGELGCGLFFCEAHRNYYDKRLNGEIVTVELCYRCGHYKKPYKPTPDIIEWVRWKLRDYSWKQWRDENPKIVEELRQRAKAHRLTNGKVVPTQESSPKLPEQIDNSIGQLRHANTLVEISFRARQ